MHTEALKRLKKLDYRLRLELLGVARRNLDDNLKILAQIGLQHDFEALERVGDRKAAEIIDEPFAIELLRIDDGSLDVVKLGKMFKRSLIQTSLSECVSRACRRTKQRFSLLTRTAGRSRRDRNL